MTIKGTTLVCLLAVATAGLAAEKAPPCSENAALRYWMALALMDNPDAESEIAKQLGQTSWGKVPWDPKLAPILDRNKDALATMHRGSRLAFCDWGLEYGLHADAPIAHLMRASALARLNVVHGMRLMHEGNSAEAAEAWMAGLRFSRHIAAGAPLLGALVSAATLGLEMQATLNAVTQKQLPAASLRAVREMLLQMPEDGFDWSETMRIELAGMSLLMQEAEQAADPVSVLQRSGEKVEPKALAGYLGLQPAELGNRDAVRASLRRARAAADALRPRVVAAFALPFDKSVPAVRELSAEALKKPFLAQGWPSLTRAQEGSRGHIIKMRADLLAALDRR